MANTPFVFELVGGVFVDASGNVLPGPPPAGTPVYSTTWTLAADTTAKIKNAANDAKAAFDGFAKSKEVLLDLRVWGGPKGYKLGLDIFKAVGDFAGIVSSVAGVVGTAFQIGELLGIFNRGPDPLQTLIQQRFDQLKGEAVAASQIDLLTRVAELRGPSNTLHEEIATFEDRRNNLTLQDFLVEQHDKRRSVEGNLSLISVMFDPSAWFCLLDDNRSTHWQWIQNRLFNITEAELARV
ncbi:MULTISPECIES: hypothetical protein [unclassified Rhodanobacter]|uniref:hypothetical protein n=1 Tax=unclassified Rhodanobacter TaxID=2621553 RepID=UPI001BE10D90|nr:MULTISPECIES: hypothetical protein [unclassified Rhodanobacter]MBT2145546.1 hypothetical protein [Rhodanobacter sp. LX-99]MBT2149591.1 hypothetical protein [Rhodanobacter sp. LX-100]